jgi:tRNA(adenine34) deaminase
MLELHNCCSSLNRRQAGAALFWAAFGALARKGQAWARATQAPARLDDEPFMRLALGEAARGDLPFGAIIVKESRVLATGHNEGKTTNDPTAHGEMMAIRHFVAARPAKDLAGATIYTTGEPCPMCMAAIVWSGFNRVVFAASIAELSAKLGQISIPSADVAAAAPFVNIEITGGVLAKDALALFRRE